ncbi:hypothetical protein FACS1894196_2900 [Clostridia bacterium]|nr:hypothetical protein FACS1894196_2900 [Clostridia bacterium]
MKQDKVREAPEEARAERQETAAPEESVEARAQLLLQQAEAIAEAGGPDMVEAFREDTTIREKVLGGEWDFQVAYGYLLGIAAAGRQARRSVPSAVRAPNSASTHKSVAAMSERELDELDERLARGEVVDPGR